MTGPQQHRIMYDTDSPETLTRAGVRADILATYADLMTVPLLASLHTAWPVVVLIDRGLGDPMHLSTVIDIEQGARTAGDAAHWYDQRHAAGARYLTTYCNRSTLPAVNAAMGKRSFYRWVATLDGTAHVPPFSPGVSPAAVQILGAGALGFPADLSLVLEPWWNPTPAGKPDNSWVAGAVNALQRGTSSLATLRQLLEAHQ